MSLGEFVMIRIAINGFGRIGRNFLRALCQDKQVLSYINVVAINCGPARIDMVAHMFKYDTLMGTYAGHVELKDTILCVDGHDIQLLAEPTIEALPWRELHIDWVVECSGRATHRQEAQKHRDAGAKRVLISAPAHDEDVAIIPGVNDDMYDPTKHHIVSLGSCTTNALLPTLKVMNDHFGIDYGFMTTVHAYTNSQVLLDVEKDDPRRSRAAALNIIPTTTGASKMIEKIIPELGQRFSGLSLRVPVAKVSFLDVTCAVRKTVSSEALNTVFQREADQGPLHNILGITYESLVSSDFSGDARSVIIDAQLTSVQSNCVKVCAWYDNEWAYSVRLKDFLYMHG